MTTRPWSVHELERCDSADELHVTAPRADGTWPESVPVWVVRVGDEVLVRTWYRRDTGWFGRAVAAGRARVRVPEVEAEVLVEDLGSAVAQRDQVDEAYRAKYARYGSATDRMTSDAAAATTLRLTPLSPASARTSSS